MDDRTKLEKVRAIANDSRAHPKMREVAQRILNRMMGNAELAIDPKFEEAYRRYQDAYACVITIRVGKMQLPKRCRPESICNHKQLKKIFDHYADWPSILTAMKQCVGCVGNEVNI